MSNPAKPAWPDLTSLPFMMFGAPAAAGSAAPLAQGLAGGVDAVKNFWGKLPGGTALPGFLVPTVDVEELDKRISDLRAAESWLEVNLNVLRATVQGLEVQRHTIAAIQSLAAMGESGPKAAATAAGGLPAGWPMASPSPAEPSPEPAPPTPAPAPVEIASAPEASTEDAMPGPGAAMAGLAANGWLGFMQDQFAKVAQAALSGSTSVSGAAPGNAAIVPAGKSPARRKAATKTAKPAAKRRLVAR